jgi:hypothetical protein
MNANTVGTKAMALQIRIARQVLSFLHASRKGSGAGGGADGLEPGSR